MKGLKEELKTAEDEDDEAETKELIYAIEKIGVLEQRPERKEDAEYPEEEKPKAEEPEDAEGVKKTQGELMGEACKAVLMESRPGKHLNVVVLPVVADQLLFDGAKYTVIKNDISRTLDKEYGLNVKVVYYRSNAKDLKAELKEASYKIEDMEGFEDPMTRVVAFSDKEKRDAIQDALSGLKQENKLAGVVNGTFEPDTATERFSSVIFTAIGIGLMDWHRATVLASTC